MDTERKISVANDSGSYEGFSDNIFDDDGFFSDVPLNGSMTKSLIALNEYVKVNLIHGDLSDAAVDREFETILRESDQGFERDKIKNEVSKDKDSIIAHTIDRNGSNNSKYFINYQENKVNLENQLTASPENTLLEGIPNDENNNFNANHESKEHASSEGNMLSDSFPYPDTPISSIAAEKRDADSKNIEDNTEINAATLNTENDISSRDDKLNRDVSKSLGNLERIEENVLKCSEKNSSAENVGARARYKLPQTNPASRHSYHDFTDWGNRTEQYPDVYAPLPYKSPRRYVESDVNIHYRCPVRRDPLPHVPERELARRQAEHMRRLYQEERRRKYLQELQDMQSRRHTDNFTPAQKSVVPLNRYDEPDASASAGGRRAAARALYAFAGQSARELSFRKGDVIGVRRQVDANWYEGELNGKVGLFPYNYVEILKGESPASSKPAPATEGRARAKFDFTAQTNLELPLKKGEVVVLTRRIDQNWWEGRHGSKTGIFPDSYVQVLAEPSLNKPEPLTPLANKPLASPASHGLLSGGAKHSMGSHSYQPQLNSAALSNGPQPNQPLAGQYAANYHAKPAQATLTPSERGYGPPSAPGVDLNNREPLYIDTNAEAVPYRAMYKYRPQNPDELELSEGDTVYVLEQCDDGWYVGSSQRSGKFGTFPGNYVERI